MKSESKITKRKVAAFSETYRAIEKALPVLRAAFGSKREAIKHLAYCVSAASSEKYDATMVPVFSADIQLASEKTIDRAASKFVLSQVSKNQEKHSLALAKAVWKSVPKTEKSKLISDNPQRN